MWYLGFGPGLPVLVDNTGSETWSEVRSGLYQSAEAMAPAA